MTAITGLRASNINELVALSCDDLSIRVVDMETKRVVRELWGCRGQINDFTFSNDSRWIIASSMDSAIRVWDLPTGHLIDKLQVPTTCTALAFSSTGEFLATAHADELGIHIWNNKSLFSTLQPKHIDEMDPEQNWVSSAITETNSGLIDAAYAVEAEGGNQEPSIISTEQLGDDLVTLSIVPRSTWQTLVNLDTIKVCLFLERFTLTRLTLNRNGINQRSPLKLPKGRLSFCRPWMRNSKLVLMQSPQQLNYRDRR
jgi:U3 small nucleolar RNA-associated protein 21